MKANGVHRDHTEERELHGYFQRSLSECKANTIEVIRQYLVAHPEELLDMELLSEVVDWRIQPDLSCLWYPTGTSSVWRVECRAFESYRFAVLYVGGCDPYETEPFSHGSRGTEK